MPTVKITLHVTNVKLTIGITTSIKYFHLTADYWSCIMFLFFFVRYDPYGCEDLCVYRYSADHLFVRASCAMSNVSAMKTGVHWGKWYSFWAMPCNSTLMYCTCTINRQCAWVSFEATAEVYNEVNHASSNENANHLEHSSTAKVGCWRRYVTLHFFCFEWYVFSCAFSKILTTPSVESKDSCWGLLECRTRRWVLFNWQSIQGMQEQGEDNVGKTMWEQPQSTHNICWDEWRKWGKYIWSLHGG